MNMISLLRGVLGLVLIIGIAILFSNNRRRISWRLVFSGIAIQVLFAIFILYSDKLRSWFTPLGWPKAAISWLGGAMVSLLGFTTEGARFVFGRLAVNSGPDSLGVFFAFQVLPTIIFVATLTSVLYYLGILQAVVKGVPNMELKSEYVGSDDATLINDGPFASTPFRHGNLRRRIAIQHGQHLRRPDRSTPADQALYRRHDQLGDFDHHDFDRNFLFRPAAIRDQTPPSLPRPGAGRPSRQGPLRRGHDRGPDEGGPGRARGGRDQARRLLVESAAASIRPVLIIALNTGMRKTEILSLKWANIDLLRGYIFIEDSKSGKPRKVPMNSAVSSAFMGLPHVADFVFYNSETKGPVRDIKTAFKAACRRAKADPKDENDSGIVGLRLHDLRHTAATKMIEAGVDLVTVSKILGHASIQMTMRYAHPTPENMKRAVDRLGDILDPTRQKVDTVEIPKPLKHSVIYN
ncbi:MAG: tyrosine-type recombinase/integrase [Candidatus Aminicenantes bacterium]|nr:tyrosine-type recombinase/integrase [Candidatus Aminicenantes bacterium]